MLRSQARVRVCMRNCTYEQKRNVETAWKQIWKFFDLFKCNYYLLYLKALNRLLLFTLKRTS